MFAENANGKAPISTNIDAIPDVKPGTITTFSTTSQYQSISVNFTAPSNTGSAINYYRIYYSKSPVTVTTSSSYVQVTSTGVTTYTQNISGLTVDGNYYNVAIASFNTLSSDLSSTNSLSRPYTNPSQPGKPSLDPGNQQITLNFAASTSSGYGTISYYRIYYSTSTVTTSTSTYVDVTTTTNALIPSPNLTNGQKYYVAIAAYNGSYSDLSDPSSVYPFTTPGDTVINSVEAGDGTITVNLTPPTNNGGFPITTYGYRFSDSVDSTTGYPNGINIKYGAFNKASTTTTTLTFPQVNYPSITNGTMYYIFLASQATNLNDIAQNVYGNIILLNAVPCTTPSAPSFSLDAANSATGTLIVNITPPSHDSTSTVNDGGNSGGSNFYTLDYYTTNNGGADSQFIDRKTGPSTTTSFTISGLTNGTTYRVYLNATNSEGTSTSFSQTGTPYTYPSAPSFSLSAGSASGTLTVNITPPSHNSITIPNDGGNSGGSDFYTLDTYSTLNGGGANDVYIAGQKQTGASTTTSFTISGLTNGTTYRVYLSTRNSKGSARSEALKIPFTYPPAPRNVASGFYNGAVVVTFQAPLTTNGGTSLSYVLVLDTQNSGGVIYRGVTNSYYTTTTYSSSNATYKFTVTNLNSGPAIQNNTTYYMEINSKTLDPNNSANELYGATNPSPVTPLAGIPTYTVGTGPSNIQITSINGATGFGTTGYYVYYNTSNSFSGVSPINIGNKTSHTIYSVFNGTDYWVKLVAYNNYGNSSDGATVKVTPTLGTFNNVVFGKMAIFGSKLYYPVFNSMYSLDSQTYQYAIVELSTEPITITKVSSLSAYPLMFFNVNGVMNVLYSTSTVKGDGTTTITGGFNATSNYFYGYNSGSNGGFFGNRNVLKIGTANTTDNTISEAGSSPLNGNTFAAADVLNDNSSLILVTDTNGPTVKYWIPPNSSSIGAVTSNTTMNYCTGIEFFEQNGFFCAYSTNTSAYSLGTYKTFFIAKGTYASNTLTTTYAKFFDASSSLIGGGVTQNHITSITYSASYLYVALYGTAASGNGSNISKVYKLTTSGTSATIVSGWPVTTIGMIQSMIVYSTTLHYSTYTGSIYTIYSIAA